jgi:hypothetical protein
MQVDGAFRRMRRPAPISLARQLLAESQRHAAGGDAAKLPIDQRGDRLQRVPVAVLPAL